MVSAIIVGAGHRAMIAASYAHIRPERFRIVGVADPLEHRRAQAAREFGLDADACFPDAESLARRGKLADCVINGTMDRQHVPTTLPLLDAGYDVLLEKPLAVDEREMRLLDERVRRLERRVMICHVLRYAPFYNQIKRRLLAGDVGRIFTIETAEHVSYHHMVAGFVRGKWRTKAGGGSSLLLAKCCHDLDLIAWFMSGVAPVRVASFGGRRFFARECAPDGAGTHCLVDCPLESACVYSARKQYLAHPERWGTYVWEPLEAEGGEASAERREEHLRRPGNPYGRCVWKLDNDLVDRQTVSVEFADGAVASHTLVGGAARPMRKVHIVGSEGEIEGCFEDNRFVVRRPDTRPGREYGETVHAIDNTRDTSGANGDHGGGDLRLVEDFVDVIEGKPASVACTSLADSLAGHRIGFGADRAREESRVVELDAPTP